MGLKALLMQGRNDRLINRYKALTGHSPKPPPFGTTMGTTTILTALKGPSLLDS